MTNHWIESAIIYHIYPRSYKDSNNDGVGDLRGIINQLDYLGGGSNSLGVNAIWLSPIYPSPMKDLGYDVTDYKNIDPVYGTLEDFDDLVQQAHKRKIKIILDYIPNHTSSNHPWFEESRQSRDNSKRDWYIWRDAAIDGGPPNNWTSVFGGSAWEYNEATSQYYYHAFDVAQPDLNWRNQNVVTEMLEVLHFWIRRGVDGFRVDAYDFLFEDSRFIDEEPNPTYVRGHHGPHDALIHTQTFAQPESLAMLQVMAKVLESYQDKFIVTEVYADIDGLNIMYQLVNKRWYAPFNFGLILNPWRADIHKTFIDELDHKIGQHHLPTWVLGNHDQPRIASRVGREQARNAAVLLMTLRGTPFIYYGDEIGMVNVNIPPEKIVDTFEKNSPGLGLGRDPERTPMQWDDSVYASFSAAAPWLPLGEDYLEYNVKAQQRDQSSFLSLYRQLILLRQKSLCLKLGEYHSINLENDSVFAYTREYEQELILVVINYTDEVEEVFLPFTHGQLLFDSKLSRNQEEITKLSPLAVDGHNAYIIKIELEGNR